MLNFDKQFYNSIPMKQLEVFNKIGGIIKELNDQYKYIEANPSELNELELELFVANAHFLADHAEILIKLNQKSKAGPVEQKETSSTEKYFEPVVQQPLPEAKAGSKVSETDEPAASVDLSSGTPEDSYSYIREEPEVIRHELVIDDDDWDEEDENAYQAQLDNEPVEEETPVMETPVTTEEAVAVETPVMVEEPVATVQEPVTLPKSNEIKPPAPKEADAKEEIITINQKISAQLGNKGNITEQAGAQPVANLKQAINLNDKLLYIKDMFNGYSLAYSEAIDILNRLDTFEEAEEFLKKNYAIKNNWESKPDTTAKFYALLKRRYS
ncbi:MAG: hypothetical protein JWQ79_658 [Mucilaginibacter sp.]|nr:hypothetical protein [Mucilaginibacter sp.]